MPVYSNTFGGLRLTGEDAAKFRDQVRNGGASASARATASEGRRLAEMLVRDGSVTIRKGAA